MIYDFPELSSPIGQGDIFFGIPIIDLTDNELPIIDDEGNAQALPWEVFASAGENVSAIVAVRPTIAIVGTQECDALRAPNITLFEVRPFRDVERKSKDTSKPSKWVPLITQHARINQKWFYLPADERLGFGEKMGTDFLTPIRVPRLTLERLIGFRKGRLNEVAKQHFRERLAEFFRRYAYDEWYPLTREELAEYQKSHPEAEPFPWQIVNADERPSSKQPSQQTLTQSESVEEHASKGHLDYLSDAEDAMGELSALLGIVNEETDVFNNRLRKHNVESEKITNVGGAGTADKLTKLYMRAAGDIHAFSEKLEEINPRFANNINDLTANVLGYIELVSSLPDTNLGALAYFRKQIEVLGQGATTTGETYRSLRDIARDLNRQKITLAFNRATHRQAEAYDKLVLNIEELESFCLKTLFLIDERFGERFSSEGIQ